MRSIVVITIENFIINAQHEKAFEYMKETVKELLKDQNLYDDLLELQIRYNKLKDQNLKHTINFESYQVELSKINESLLTYKNKIEKSINEREPKEDLSDPELNLLIYTNAYASTIKDIEMVSKTLHAEVREEMVAGYGQIFASNLELIYIIKSINIVELAEEFATASVVQTTTRKDPSVPFRDNDIKMNHTFAKENGRWKIFSSILQEIKYF